MNFLKHNFKSILVLTIVIVGGFYIYSYFFGGSTDTSPLSVTTPDVGSSEAGRDLLLLLAELKTLRLDESIFTDPQFRNLKNFRVELIPEPIGRDNPFAPISGATGSGNSVKIKSFKTQ